MLLKNILYFVLLFLLIFMVVTALYHIVLFVSYHYDPYYLEIDSCLDQGGRWDQQSNTCQY